MINLMCCQFPQHYTMMLKLLEGMTVGRY